MSAPIHLVKGSDPVLVGDATTTLVAGLLAGRDRTEAVDELSGDEFGLDHVAMAASSISMFGDQIVVARNAGRFKVDELEPLLNYLADPNPSSTVVWVWEAPVSVEARPLPKKLADVVKGAGGTVHDTDVPVQAKQRSAWLDRRLGEMDVALTSAARAKVADRFGEDVARVTGLVAVLEGSFPSGTKLDADDIEPFLGDAGSVPPWDLTDAIDRGDVTAAVSNLQRMLRGGRHPLQVIATLQTHVERMLRLDGADVGDEQEAAALLGMKGSTYPAKKALAGSRRMGSERLRQAIVLLAEADVDLRGASGWPSELVMEVLVGRMARLSGRR